MINFGVHESSQHLCPCSSSNDDLTSNLDFFQELASSSLKKGFDGMLSNVDASESLIEN